MSEHSLTLDKSERLCSRRLIDGLFAEGMSVTSFPVRIVYRLCKSSDSSATCGATVLFSVSKRHFKRAVCRNRVKRQMREMYRRSKMPLAEYCAAAGTDIHLAFVFGDSRLWESGALAVRFSAAFDKLLTELRQNGGAAAG